MTEGVLKDVAGVWKPHLPPCRVQGISISLGGFSGKRNLPLRGPRGLRQAPS